MAYISIGQLLTIYCHHPAATLNLSSSDRDNLAQSPPSGIGELNRV